ncbi:MAG: YhbY family RNA-binding protein [Candidatus Methanomethylicia archaeon]
MKYKVKDIPKINIGKYGLTENLLKELDRQLDEHEFIKIKILKTASIIYERDKGDVASQLASILNAEIIDIRGRTIVLYRKQRIYKRKV